MSSRPSRHIVAANQRRHGGRPYHTGRAHRVPPGARRGISPRSVARSASKPAEPSAGIHLLRSRPIIESVVASAGLTPDTLVLDLGAGPGTLTEPLARTGARVIAIERDPKFLARLHRRFGDRPNVRVVAADLRDVPLPRRTFRVVASIPYSLSTVLLRRLLGPADSPCEVATLVVEWGFAKRVTARQPRDLEVAWWASRYQLRMVRRISAAAFAPPPAVDSAQLVAVRRPEMADLRTQRALAAMLRQAYGSPGETLQDVVATVVPRRRVKAYLTRSGIPTGRVVACGLTPDQWSRLARCIAEDPHLITPRLPPDMTGKSA